MLTFLRKIKVASRCKVSRRALDSAIYQSFPQSLNHNPKVVAVDFGGVNNVGMFVFYDENSEPLAIAKIQGSKLAEREFRFMRWQTELSELRLSPSPVSNLICINSNFSIICSEYLLTPSKYDFKKVFDLYNRIGTVKNASNLEINELKLRDEIIPDTPIKAVLHYFVSNPDMESSLEYLYRLIDTKRDILGTHMCAELNKLTDLQYDSWLEIMDIENFGIVHGDFKPQNILVDREGFYRVIDLQYYLIGNRSWDLAFYLSKKSTFVDVAECLDEIHLDYIDRKRIIFFYIFAVVVGIRKKSSHVSIENKISPAIRKYWESPQ